jgi:PAS domain S-box-containing protein
MASTIPALPGSEPPGPLATADELLAALPWGVLVLDAQAVIRRVNRQAAQWCGMPAGSLLDQPLAQAPLPPALSTALRQLREPGSAPLEVWLPAAQQWLNLRAAPAPAGQHWIFLENVTARHQAETARQRSGQLLLDMEAVARTGSYEADLTSGSLYFSDGMYLLFGEAPQAFEVTLAVIDARSHPADAAIVRQVLDEAIQKKQPYTYRRRIRRADGEWRTLEAHGEVRADAAGRAVQLRGLVQDVTERVQAEQELRETKELLQATLNSSRYVVQARPVRNAQGEITAWFGAATDIHARKLAALRLRRAAETDAFRVKLSDALRSLADVADMQGEPTRLLREWLDAGWCYYNELDDTGTYATVLRDAVRAGLPSFAGVHDLSAAPEYTAYLRAGKVLNAPDIRASGLFSPPIIARYVALGMYAALGVPLVKDGQLRAVLVVADTAPRTWPAEAVTLVQEVAERIWAAAERARAEAALAASEQRLRALIANLPGAAAFVVGPDLRYQLAGGEALAVAGIAPADLVGRTVAEAMPPELVPQYEAYYRQAFGGHAFSVEHTAHGHNFISRGVPLPGFAGQAEAVLVVSYDITKRKQAEEALLVSEMKYRTLFETMDQGFGIGQVLPAEEATGAPLDWQWLEVNPQFERLTGLLRADVLSQTTRRLIPGLEEIWYERYAQAAAGETVNFESYSPVLDRWFDVYAFALGPPDNRRVAVLFSNTSEQKQVEAALREAEARYRQQLEQQVIERTQQLQESRDLLQSVLDTSLISMSVLHAERDEAGQVQDFRLGLVNKELERETGRTDLVGKLYGREYPGIRQVGIFDLMLRALATDEPQTLEYFYDHEGFNRWYTCQFVKMGDGVVATNLDITERKMAEQERLKNLRLLEQAEAVAGLGSWDYDLTTKYMRWSQGMYHLFGLPVGSPIEPSHYLAAVVEDDRPRAEQLVRQLVAGRGFEETLRLRVHGQVKTVRMKAVILRDEASQPVRILGVDVDISELQRLEADNLRLRLTQQQALFEAVQAAQEAERKRMAESLHNGIGQILYATKLRLDLLRSPLLAAAPAQEAARQEADHLLGDAIRQARALSHELVPMMLEEFGLAAALQDIGQKMSTAQLHLRTHVVLDDEAASLTPTLQMALYRMAQELAQNIAKHAHRATEASLELETTPGWVLLRVEDNGPGFAAPPASVPGLGLRSIRDQVALLGGRVETGSMPAGGAYVRIRIPLPMPG